MLAFLFFFGLAIGSFLNVLVLRFNTGENLRGRSRCFSCLKKLSWVDLVPLASYMVVRGRCRYCGSKISAQYPIVELATAIVFTITGWVMLGTEFKIVSTPFVLEFLAILAFFSILIAISVYDIRHKIIPDQLSLALFVVAVLFEGIDAYQRVYEGAEPVFSRILSMTTSSTVLYDIIGAVCAFLFFASIWFLSRGMWMGFGDAKLALSLGLFLGYPGVIFGIVLAFWLGSIFGIAMLALGSYTGKTEVPFAPFLALGTFVAFVLIVGNFVPWYYNHVTVI